MILPPVQINAKCVLPLLPLYGACDYTKVEEATHIQHQIEYYSLRTLLIDTGHSNTHTTSNRILLPSDAFNRHGP
jgi:hypothetical protein